MTDFIALRDDVTQRQALETAQQAEKALADAEAYVETLRTYYGLAAGQSIVDQLKAQMGS